MQTDEQVEKKKEAVLSVREALSTKKNDFRDTERDDDDLNDDDDDDDDDGFMFDLKMRSQILKKRKELGDAAVRDKPSIGIILCYLLLVILFCQHYSFLPF
jgi:peptidyl-prolyl cis-trans isomerase SDCCAG10